MADDWHYLLTDALGSVHSLVSASQNVASVQSYDPYGNPESHYGAGFGFTGEQTDENGQLYLRARYYNPALGVFPSLDPFEGLVDRPMSLNGYSWVEGNPINLTDPSGKQPCIFCGGPLEFLCFGACNNHTTPSNSAPIATECPTLFPLNTNTPQMLGTPQPTPFLFITNTPEPEPTSTPTRFPPFVTNTPEPTVTLPPSVTPTPTSSPPSITLYSVFGESAPIILPGANTGIYSQAHPAIDIIPANRPGDATGAQVFAVCSGTLQRGSGSYYTNIVEQYCGNYLIIYSHICPDANLGGNQSPIAAGASLGQLAGLFQGGVCSSTCCDDGKGIPFYGGAHLHFEVHDIRSRSKVPPAWFISECRSSDRPSWCADAENISS